MNVHAELVPTHIHGRSVRNLKAHIRPREAGLTVTATWQRPPSVRHPKAPVIRTMPTKIAPREHAKALIDRAIRKAIFRSFSKPNLGILQYLSDIRGRSELLRPARYRGRFEYGWLDTILDGLLALYRHRREWLRPLHRWEPRESNPLPLFSSLAHHLLADYPVPPVLLSAWFRGDTWQGRQQQGWFKLAGLGTSLRAVGFPIRVTRRMAHEFAHAPAHYPVDFALRWAQVKGLGGSDNLAGVVASTRLGRAFENDDFWTSVFHLFINSVRLDPAHVDPIVEYLQDRKFEARRVIIGEDTELFLEPSRPDLTVNGRTVASLMRRVVAWQAERKEQAVRTLIRWDRSSIGEFIGQDPAGRTWTIRELLDSDEMAAEGKAMDHCVAGYTDCCVKRLSTIWSVRVEVARAASGSRRSRSTRRVGSWSRRRPGSTMSPTSRAWPS